MQKTDLTDSSNNATQIELDKFREFLEGQRGQEVITLEMDGPQSFADAMLVCGASSKRHAQGLADGIAQICRENGYEFLGMEGYDAAEWILLDCNNIIVHIFQEEPRKLYRLEDLWGRARALKEAQE